jgi:hypothetical protein
MRALWHNLVLVMILLMLLSSIFALSRTFRFALGYLEAAVT